MNQLAVLAWNALCKLNVTRNGMALYLDLRWEDPNKLFMNKAYEHLHYFKKDWQISIRYFQTTFCYSGFLNVTIHDPNYVEHNLTLEEFPTYIGNTNTKIEILLPLKIYDKIDNQFYDDVLSIFLFTKVSKRLFEISSSGLQQFRFNLTTRDRTDSYSQILESKDFPIGNDEIKISSEVIDTYLKFTIKGLKNKQRFRYYIYLLYFLKDYVNGKYSCRITLSEIINNRKEVFYEFLNDRYVFSLEKYMMKLSKYSKYTPIFAIISRKIDSGLPSKVYFLKGNEFQGFNKRIASSLVLDYTTDLLDNQACMDQVKSARILGIRPMIQGVRAMQEVEQELDRDIFLREIRNFHKLKSKYQLKLRAKRKIILWECYFQDNSSIVGQTIQYSAPD